MLVSTDYSLLIYRNEKQINWSNKDTFGLEIKEKLKLAIHSDAEEACIYVSFLPGKNQLKYSFEYYYVKIAWKRKAS